jgi:hypothetical protein
MTTTTTATTDARPDAHEEWERELLKSLYDWANSGEEQRDMCVEVEGILEGVNDELMTRVLMRRGWYLVPNLSTYPTDGSLSTQTSPSCSASSI